MKQSYSYSSKDHDVLLEVNKGLNDERVIIEICGEYNPLTINEAKQLKSALTVAIDVATHNAEQK